MQTNGRKMVIMVAEGTDKPPVEEIYRKFEELGDGWRIVSTTTTSETVNGKLSMGGRSYRRYLMTTVAERS